MRKSGLVLLFSILANIALATALLVQNSRIGQTGRYQFSKGEESEFYVMDTATGTVYLHGMTSQTPTRMVINVPKGTGTSGILQIK